MGARSRSSRSSAHSIRSLDERRPSRRCRSTRMTRYGTDWKARRLSALSRFSWPHHSTRRPQQHARDFRPTRDQSDSGIEVRAAPAKFEGDRRRRSAGSIVLTSMRFDVADGSTELRFLSAASTASFAGELKLARAAARRLATGGTDVVPASAEANAASRRQDGSALRGGGETVCRSMTRPGSRIAERVCYTREEELAAQAASNRMVADLEREQQWREQAIHEAAMKNRFPGVPGMPNR